ncbi:hypothetical protein TPAR_00146, partial [Tolypocladium paradoxum]
MLGAVGARREIKDGSWPSWFEDIQRQTSSTLAPFKVRLGDYIRTGVDYSSNLIYSSNQASLRSVGRSLDSNSKWFALLSLVSSLWHGPYMLPSPTLSVRGTSARGTADSSSARDASATPTALPSAVSRTPKRVAYAVTPAPSSAARDAGLVAAMPTLKRRNRLGQLEALALAAEARPVVAGASLAAAEARRQSRQQSLRRRLRSRPRLQSLRRRARLRSLRRRPRLRSLRH